VLLSGFAPIITQGLSLHDALPIFELLVGLLRRFRRQDDAGDGRFKTAASRPRCRRDADDLTKQVEILVEQVKDVRFDEKLDLFRDRKSTRLNSSNFKISYPVFCFK